MLLLFGGVKLHTTCLYQACRLYHILIVYFGMASRFIHSQIYLIRTENPRCFSEFCFIISKYRRNFGCLYR